jgi:RNA polymerase-binding transcription factor DksA
MPLSQSQRDHLERRLQEERARLLRTLHRTGPDEESGDQQDQASDLSKVPFHLADLGTDTMDAELEASNVTRMSRELAEIDAALERLYHTPERFGICEDTGREIAFERLDVIPWARTCEQSER